MIGYVLWALLLAAMLTLEGLGLTLEGRHWPTVSDLFRSTTRPLFGRWLFFALWLWAGWHFFIRGWQFFLQGSGAHEPGRGLGDGKGFFGTITQVCIPLFAVFVTLMLIGRNSRRMAVDGDASELSPRAAESRTIALRPLTFARYALVTLVGGYGLFVAVMGVYQLVVGKSASDDFTSAARYGAFLGFLVGFPAFVVIAFAQSAVRRHRAPGRGRG
jgi:hypothetical protein